MMTRFALLAALMAAPVLASALSPAPAHAEAIRLQLRDAWGADGAGYAMAQARGLYRAAGLAVAIRPGDADTSPAQALARGDADVIVDWLPAALVARERGLPVVRLAQVFARPTLGLACLEGLGIDDPAQDLGARPVGVWFGGAHYAVQAWLGRDVGLAAQGGDALAARRLACVATRGPAPAGAVRFAPPVALPEDGLYALASALDDPAGAARLARFVAATQAGWQAAAADPVAAAQAVRDAGGAADAAQVAGYAALLGPDRGGDAAIAALVASGVLAGAPGDWRRDLIPPPADRATDASQTRPRTPPSGSE